MGKRLGIIGNYLAHYKYLIVILLGVVYVGLLDENSVYQHMRYQMQISDLEDQIDGYNKQYERDAQQLKEMRHGSKTYERIARERYFMKADEEDVFVLSTDLENETTENSPEADNDNETAQ